MPVFTESVPETFYLSVPGVAHYRVIMRMMYIENERFHYPLYPEEILELVKQNEGFDDYTILDLKQDLAQLVEWNNLIAIQDPGIVRTIAEYKNKQYRYSMSDRAIEVERLTIRLENLDMESGNLSSNYFLRIESALRRLEDEKKMNLEETAEWWHMLQEDFKVMNQNYKDYLRDFYSPEAANLLKSVEFVLHKDRFIQYLEKFIRQMQLQSRKIGSLLLSVNDRFNNEVLDQIVTGEMQLPRTSKSEKSAEEIHTDIENRWLSFERWFISMDGQKAECDRILEITNEIIRNIIENANLIVQMSNYGVSRKDDYRHFIEMFLDCETMSDAHCLSAHLFGIQHIQHIRTDSLEISDDLKGSAYKQCESTAELESHSRTYREKRAKEGVVDRSMDKMMERVRYVEEINRKNEMVRKYMQDDVLDIADIQDVIPSFLRTAILTWISNANMSVSRTGRTETGWKFHLKKMDETCTLKCEDGNIIMPRYILEFENDNN